MREPHIIDCADCGERKRHHGRNLCGACWKNHRREGTLEQFSRVRLRFRDNPENHIELTGGEWVKSPTNPWLRVWRETTAA